MANFGTKETVKRGPVVEVTKRCHSDPIPDELLARFNAAGLVLDDNDHAVIVYRAGSVCGSVWGPAVEGDWFGGTKDNVRRLPTRDEALAYVLDAATEAKPEEN